MTLLRRLARALEVAGGRALTWTVRRPHGVHLVELRRSPLGDGVAVDGQEVVRADPWRYQQTLRFTVGDARAELRYLPDTETGTLANDLYVGGEPVAPDPREREAEVPRGAWRTWLERGAYALGAALAVAGAVGDPVFALVRQVVWTGALVVLLAGLRAVDPLGVIALGVDKMVEDRVSMMVAGAEVVVLALIAADRFGLRRRLPFVREPRALPRVLGWIALVAIAFAVLEVS